MATPKHILAMPNRSAPFVEAPVIHLETAEQVARARAQLKALQSDQAGSVDDLLRVALEAAIQAYESVPTEPPPPADEASDPRSAI